MKAGMEGWKSCLKGAPAPVNAPIEKDSPGMTDDRLAVGVTLLDESGRAFGGNAAQLGLGILTDGCMKKAFDLTFSDKPVDPANVDLNRTCTVQFLKGLKVLP